MTSGYQLGILSSPYFSLLAHLGAIGPYKLRGSMFPKRLLEATILAGIRFPSHFQSIEEPNLPLCMVPLPLFSIIFRNLMSSGSLILTLPG